MKRKMRVLFASLCLSLFVSSFSSSYSFFLSHFLFSSHRLRYLFYLFAIRSSQSVSITYWQSKCHKRWIEEWKMKIVKNSNAHTTHIQSFHCIWISKNRLFFFSLQMFECSIYCQLFITQFSCSLFLWISIYLYIIIYVSCNLNIESYCCINIIAKYTIYIYIYICYMYICVWWTHIYSHFLQYNVRKTSGRARVRQFYNSN